MAVDRESISRRSLLFRGDGAVGVALIFNVALFLAAIPGATQTAATPSAPLKVDPNTAPVALLQTLPRIGPALARRMVEAREQAPFVSLDDIDRRVFGLGPATAKAIEPFLAFETPAAAESKP